MLPQDFLVVAGAVLAASVAVEDAAPGRCTQSVGLFCAGGTRPSVQAMTNFIDVHCAARGVEPVCTVLQIASSADYTRLATRADPGKAAARQ